MDYIKYLGTPYKFNGKNQDDGFDCMNLCLKIAKDRGVPMADVNYDHTSIDTYQYLFNLRSTDMFTEVTKQKDSLVVFRVAGVIGHVGYMVDDEHFIHILQESRVSIENINSPRWSKRVIGFYKYAGGSNG